MLSVKLNTNYFIREAHKIIFMNKCIKSEDSGLVVGIKSNCHTRDLGLRGMLSVEVLTRIYESFGENHRNLRAARSTGN